ncbi:Peptidase M16 inactive domain family [Synechococcus sp. PCC 7335]|uniref:M16 family metallopeptidase n=1 Tax=Synechococcus sp. (strain ATCC 29403 / PCC 7335) TaxID=91464 RepID=UPI00017ECAB8|nr:pitrilysin family protein [Synechococcus sp. PCC 7335]EDX87384.1 Peptidase M16 inactive domain family [Synechococcus sp. PCC 7335]
MVSHTSSEITSPTIRRLANGLTIIAEHMPIDAVNLSVWLNIGSKVESDAINGMAHFLEHMIFKGTPRLGFGEFERLIEERGAHTNAATSQDYTHYYITTAPPDFATLAPLQIELLLNASLQDDHFDKERPVILEEIRRAEDSPQRRAFYRSMQMSFDTLPYRRPVLGPTSVVEDLSAEQMRAFHHTWYQPQNMTAVAVGNLPVEELIRIVEEGFDQALARSDRNYASDEMKSQVPASHPELPFPKICRMEYIDESLQQARLVMDWRVPGMQSLEETYPLDVVASILGQGRMARLIHDLREQRQLVNSISASNMTFCNQGIFSISARTSVEKLAVAEAAIIEHLQRLHDEPVTAAELRRVQIQVANRFIFGNETPSDRAGLYGYYQSITGDINHAIDYPQCIRDVSVEAVQAAVQRYLPTHAYGVVSFKPV